MIKLIIFDMDGVLVDVKDLHYEALNRALEKVCGDSYVINREDHLSKFDGLPTKTKLGMLIKERGLNIDHCRQIVDLKKQIFGDMIKENNFYSSIIKETLDTLHRDGLAMGVATNAIRSTLDYFLHHLRIFPYIRFSLSNEDIENAKPHPEIYSRIILEFQVSPKETLVLEDALFGQISALKSGANLMQIRDSKDVNYFNIRHFINLYNIL